MPAGAAPACAQTGAYCEMPFLTDFARALARSMTSALRATSLRAPPPLVPAAAADAAGWSRAGVLYLWETRQFLRWF